MVVHCLLCGGEKATEEELELHLHRHFKYKKYACDDCDELFYSETERQDHCLQLQHHNMFKTEMNSYVEQLLAQVRVDSGLLRSGRVDKKHIVYKRLQLNKQMTVEMQKEAEQSQQPGATRNERRTPTSRASATRLQTRMQPQTSSTKDSRDQLNNARRRSNSGAATRTEEESESDSDSSDNEVPRLTSLQTPVLKPPRAGRAKNKELTKQTLQKTKSPKSAGDQEKPRMDSSIASVNVYVTELATEIRNKELSSTKAADIICRLCRKPVKNIFMIRRDHILETHLEGDGQEEFETTLENTMRKCFPGEVCSDFQCTKCGYTTGKNICVTTMVNHINRMHNVINVKCPFENCGASERVSDIQNHMKYWHGDAYKKAEGLSNNDPLKMVITRYKKYAKMLQNQFLDECFPMRSYKKKQNDSCLPPADICAVVQNQNTPSTSIASFSLPVSSRFNTAATSNRQSEKESRGDLFPEVRLDSSEEEEDEEEEIHAAESQGRRYFNDAASTQSLLPSQRPSVKHNIVGFTTNKRGSFNPLNSQRRSISRKVQVQTARQRDRNQEIREEQMEVEPDLRTMSDDSIFVLDSESESSRIGALPPAAVDNSPRVSIDENSSNMQLVRKETRWDVQEVHVQRQEAVARNWRPSESERVSDAHPVSVTATPRLPINIKREATSDVLTFSSLENEPRSNETFSRTEMDKIEEKVDLDVMKIITPHMEERREVVREQEDESEQKNNKLERKEGQQFVVKQEVLAPISDDDNDGLNIPLPTREATFKQPTASSNNERSLPAIETSSSSLRAPLLPSPTLTNSSNRSRNYRSKNEKKKESQERGQTSRQGDERRERSRSPPPQRRNSGTDRDREHYHHHSHRRGHSSTHNRGSSRSAVRYTGYR